MRIRRRTTRIRRHLRKLASPGEEGQLAAGDGPGACPWMVALRRGEARLSGEDGPVFFYADRLAGTDGPLANEDGRLRPRKVASRVRMVSSLTGSVGLHPSPLGRRRRGVRGPLRGNDKRLLVRHERWPATLGPFLKLKAVPGSVDEARAQGFVVVP